MSKLINTVHSDGGKEYVHSASNYTTNEDSVLAKGFGVTTDNPQTTEMQFNQTAKFWDNENKNPFIHLTMAFTPSEAPDANTALAIAEKAIESVKDDHLVSIGIHEKEMENSNYHAHVFIQTTNFKDGSMIYPNNSTIFPIAQSIADQTGEKCTLIKKKENNMTKDFRQTFYPHK